MSCDDELIPFFCLMQVLFAVLAAFFFALIIVVMVMGYEFLAVLMTFCFFLACKGSDDLKKSLDVMDHEGYDDPEPPCYPPAVTVSASLCDALFSTY